MKQMYFILIFETFSILFVMNFAFENRPVHHTENHH